MKIAFVNDSSERMGVEYICAVLKKNGHNVEVFVDPQLFNESYIYFKSLSRVFCYSKIIIKQLKSFRPDLIGVSIDTESYQWACTIARMVKAELPDVPIIFGGIHPTSVPERVIQNDFVDMLCVGEGEYPMLELANSLEKGAIDYSIKNIWFKKDKEVIRNEIRPLIENLDELPYADHDIYYRVNPHLRKNYYINASRGCPNACSYCCHSYIHELYRGKGSNFRQRSVEHVIQELVEAKNRYNMKYVLFLDDCFTFDINWLRDFSNLYKERIGTKFLCNVHPEHVSPESAEYLKNAGCRQVILGIQSWSPRIRQGLLNRKVLSKAMKEAIKTITRSKIDLLVDNLYGFSNQDNEEYIRSLIFYTYIKPRRIFFFKLKYFPSTKLTRDAKENGLISAAESEAVNEGVDIKGVRFDSFLYLNKEREEKNLAKIKMLLFLLDCIPPGLSYLIIRKKLYRFFPSIMNPDFLIALRSLLSYDIDTQILRSGILGRYAYFVIYYFKEYLSSLKGEPGLKWKKT
jgi:radical SAM superfamily enzyme YgiQ (UPF0313 family)